MSTLDEATAVILAGGLGTRLRPVVADRPKVLAHVRGKPFLAYLLEQVASAAIRHCILCVGYLGEQIRAAFGDSYAGMYLVYSQESMPLGTAGALRLALPLSQSDTVLAMNGDSFCGVNLSDLWAWHSRRNANATLVLVETSNTTRYGRVSVAADGTIVGFDKKKDGEGVGWINAGIYVLRHALIESIPTRRAVSLETDMFPAWTGQGLYGYRSTGRFLDIGTPESYVLADQFFAL